MKDKKGILAKIIRYIVLLQVFGALLSGLIILWIQIFTIKAGTLPFELDRYALLRIHPGYYTLPLISSIISLFYLYTFLRLKSLSKKNWLLAFFSLTIIPTNSIYLALKFTRPVVNSVYTSFSWQGTLIDILNANYKIFISLFSSISVLGISIIIMILIRSRFNERDQALTQKALKVLFGYFLIVVIPILTITVFGFYKANNISDDYNKIQSSVDFKLRKANYLPEGMNQRTKYFINNAKGVNILYEYGELKDAYLGIPYKEGRIVISQNKADQNRSIENAIKNKLFDDQVNEIQLNNAKDKKAIFFINSRANDRLVFITDDTTIVQILGSKIDHSEYIKIAEGLR